MYSWAFGMALSSTILITIYCKQIFNQIKILNFDVKMYYYSHVSTIIFFIYYVNQIKWCKWCMRARCRRVCETILTYKYLYWKLLHRNNKKTKNGYWDNLKKKLYSKCCIFYTHTPTHKKIPNSMFCVYVLSINVKTRNNIMQIVNHLIKNIQQHENKCQHFLPFYYQWLWYKKKSTVW